MLYLNVFSKIEKIVIQELPVKIKCVFVSGGSQITSQMVSKHIGLFIVHNKTALSKAWHIE